MYPMSAPGLGPLALQLKRHWATYLPKMTAELRAQGTLDVRLHETAQQMLEQEATMIHQGMAPDQARETTREIGFLPAEGDDAETTLMNASSEPSKEHDQHPPKSPMNQKFHDRLVEATKNHPGLGQSNPPPATPKEMSAPQSKLPVTRPPKPKTPQAQKFRRLLQDAIKNCGPLGSKTPPAAPPKK
jgi:hypothetical protein